MICTYIVYEKCLWDEIKLKFWWKIGFYQLHKHYCTIFAFNLLKTKYVSQNQKVNPLPLYYGPMKLKSLVSLSTQLPEQMLSVEFQSRAIKIFQIICMKIQKTKFLMFNIGLVLGLRNTFLLKHIQFFSFIMLQSASCVWR